MAASDTGKAGAGAGAGAVGTGMGVVGARKGEEAGAGASCANKDLLVAHLIATKIC